MYHNHHYPVCVGSVTIGFINCWPDTPWEVYDQSTGEIRPFPTYGEAYSYAKSV